MRSIIHLAKHLPLVVAMFVLFSVVAEEPPVKDIRDTLTKEEFRKAGLEKLSDAELDYLSGILYGRKSPRTVVAAPRPVTVTTIDTTPEERFGSEDIPVKEENKPEIPDSIQSRILGSFSGWAGDTVFTLENGQVWEQISKDHFKVHLTDPKVEIRKGSFGTYFLKIEGYGSRCKVKRVK